MHNPQPEMLVPSTDYFRPAVLRALADGEVKSFREVADGAADVLNLSEEARNEYLDKSEQYRFHNRANWATSSFAKAGLIKRVRRGFYQITDLGRIVDARNLETYTEKDMLEWPMWAAYQNEVAERRSGQHEKHPDAHSAVGSGSEQGLVTGGLATEGLAPSPASVRNAQEASALEDTDPIEGSHHLMRLHNATVETELRQRLQAGSPEFFEKAVIDLLWAMGYGGSKGEREHLGKVADGGIDGVIRQDPLGLNNVYIQAKRYADNNTVGSPAINEFYGSLSARGADRGVFITTSRFTPAAQQAAQHFKTIILIDGIKLTKLMLEYQVGVQPTQTLTFYQVDEDFFEEDNL